jgi:predicted transposase YbfD/YdcC
LEQVKTHFTRSNLVASLAAVNKAHGRIETRTCQVILDLGLTDEAANWAGIQSVIKVQTCRKEVLRDKANYDGLYSIPSLAQSAEAFNRQIRQLWGIENQLHWVLDVQYKEDHCRQRRVY